MKSKEIKWMLKVLFFVLLARPFWTRKDLKGTKAWKCLNGPDTPFIDGELVKTGYLLIDFTLKEIDWLIMQADCTAGWLAVFWWTSSGYRLTSTGPGWILVSIQCKKRLMIFLSPAGMSLTKLSLAGSVRESLVSDIPAGDGNQKLFFAV